MIYNPKKPDGKNVLTIATETVQRGPEYLTVETETVEQPARTIALNIIE